MKIPFSAQEFFNTFKQYNVIIFPFQFVLVFSALICTICTFKEFKYSARIIFFVLCFLWLWMGIVYHLLFFTHINKAAYLFAITFIIEGALLFAAAIKNEAAFKIQKNIFRIAAVCLVCYALLIYPLLGYLQHRRFPFAPTFGLPCPTTIFTFGILMLASSKLPLYIFLIPFFWCIIGTTAAFQLSVKEDFGLTISAIIFVIYTTVQHKKFKTAISTPGQEEMSLNDAQSI